MVAHVYHEPRFAVNPLAAGVLSGNAAEGQR